MSMRGALLGRARASMVSPSGNSSFWLLQLDATPAAARRESFRIVSGMVPSRAVRVSVKVGGVVTWPATSSIAAVAASRWARRSSSSRPAAGGEQQVPARAGRAAGCRRPTRAVKVSSSARRADRTRARCRRRCARRSPGSSDRSDGVAATVEDRARRGRRRRPASRPRRAARSPIACSELLDGAAGSPGVEPERRWRGRRSAARGGGAPARRAPGSRPARASRRRVEPLHHDRVGRQRRARRRGCGRRASRPPSGTATHEGLGERVADDAVGERLEVLVVDDQPVGAGEGERPRARRRRASGRRAARPASGSTPSASVSTARPARPAAARPRRAARRARGRRGRAGRRARRAPVRPAAAVRIAATSSASPGSSEASSASMVSGWTDRVAGTSGRRGEPGDQRAELARRRRGRASVVPSGCSASGAPSSATIATARFGASSPSSGGTMRWVTSVVSAVPAASWAVSSSGYTPSVGSGSPPGWVEREHDPPRAVGLGGQVRERDDQCRTRSERSSSPSIDSASSDRDRTRWCTSRAMLPSAGTPSRRTVDDERSRRRSPPASATPARSRAPRQRRAPPRAAAARAGSGQRAASEGGEERRRARRRVEARAPYDASPTARRSTANPSGRSWNPSAS